MALMMLISVLKFVYIIHYKYFHEKKYLIAGLRQNSFLNGVNRVRFDFRFVFFIVTAVI